MEISGFHIPTTLNAGVIFASVYGAFSRFDRIQSRSNRQFISRWLLGLDVAHIQWSAFFTELFQRFFGQKHWSWKCAARSFFLTLTISVILSIELIHKRNFHFNDGIAFATICIADYLCLWKTRLLLTKVPLTRFGPFGYIGLIGGDAVLTTTIYLTCVSLALIAIWINLGWGIEKIFYKLIDNADDFLTFRIVRIKAPGTILYATALLTSGWVWSYGIVAVAMRALSYLPYFIAILGRVADLKEHPVRTIGFFAAALIAGIVALGTAF